MPPTSGTARLKSGVASTAAYGRISKAKSNARRMSPTPRNFGADCYAIGIRAPSSEPAGLPAGRERRYADLRDEGGSIMTMRVLIAGILGAIAMYVWSTVAHVALPLGQLGLSQMPNEAAVLS